MALPYRRVICATAAGGILTIIIVVGIYLAKGARQDHRQPHIIFIMADDLGWADVSFHGSNQIPTPNLDALAADGVILNNYYVHPMCTASRAAFMTGLYAIRYGLQHHPIQPGEPYGLDLKYILLPQHLKKLGYETHLIGKWHLGCYSYEYTPTCRGFDTFYGLYYGHGDYFTHNLDSKDGSMSGLDFWNGTDPALDARGHYSTDVFAEKAELLIKSLNPSKPQFLYLSHQAPHSGNDKNRLQAPKENIEQFGYIGEKNRTIYAAMVSVLDAAVGRVVQALSEAGMLENSVIVFSSDNGGVPAGHLAGRGINWPLRGIKGSTWEGGCRAAAFIWSPLISKARRVSQQLLQITDWLPTFHVLAGGSVRDLGVLDGQDVWATLSQDDPSPRREVVYNIDPVEAIAGMRRDRYKIVVGHKRTAALDQRYSIPGEERPWHDLDALMEQSLAAEALRSLHGTHNLSFSPHWREYSTLTCSQERCGNDTYFQSADHVYLFDLEEDPCECNNLASSHKQLLESLNQTLEQYKAETVTEKALPVDPAAYPRYHNGTWAPWIE